MDLKTLYSLDDLCIIPAVSSDIDTRSECDVYTFGGMLPVFTAPMSSVVSVDNYKTFMNYGIEPIIPKTKNLSALDRVRLCREVFCSFDLKEFEEWFTTNKAIEFTGINEIYFVLIDIANGHMRKLKRLIETAKKIYKSSLNLMVGNIANPMTYIELEKLGVEYVRVGIGGGSVCTTSVHSGVHYPMGSLLLEINKIKQDFYKTYDRYPVTKVIADGGLNTIDKCIKALCCGADYVMIGHMFAECEEACGDKYYKNQDNVYIHENVISDLDKQFAKGPYLKYYGMSTKIAQEERGKIKYKEDEGITKFVKIKYNLSTWCNKFTHFLTDCMSYIDCDNIYNMRYAQMGVLTPTGRMSYNTPEKQ